MFNLTTKQILSILNEAMIPVYLTVGVIVVFLYLAWMAHVLNGSNGVFVGIISLSLVYTVITRGYDRYKEIRKENDQ